MPTPGIPASLLALSLLLGACGGADDPAALADAGTQALNSGNYEDARADFRRASELVAGDASHAQFKRIELGGIEAQAYLDPAKARDELLALAAENQGLLQDRDYSAIATAMVQTKEFGVAIDVIDAGRKAFPDSQRLVKLTDAIVAESKRSGDSKLLDKLRGLGYTGE